LPAQLFGAFGVARIPMRVSRIQHFLGVHLGYDQA
jgi:hypothetical protein